MELVSFRVPRKQSEKDPVVIGLIGDIQYTGKTGTTAFSRLKDYVMRCVDLQAWIIGLGDYLDFASPSNRQRLKAAALYETAELVVANAALDLTTELYETVLKPLTGRFLILHSGHHWLQLPTGDTTDMRLAQLLKTRFVGTSAFTRLQFEVGNNRMNCVIFSHHGVGAGQKAYSPLTKLENLAPYFDADIMVMAHTCKTASSQLNRIEPRWSGRGAPDLTHKKILLVGAGGWSLSYKAGSKQGLIASDGYAGQKLYAPATIGSPLIYIRPNRHEAVSTNGRRSTIMSFEASVET